MGNGARALIGVGAIAVAVVLFIVLQDSGSDDPEPATTAAEETTPAETTTDGGGGDSKPEKSEKPDEPEKPGIATIEVRNGAPVGGVAELEFDQGDDIEFYVLSDVADHVHLHGYDIFKDVAAGERVKFSLPASIPGIFEAELEDSVVEIAKITVNPS